jgi:hypothetical protein
MKLKMFRQHYQSKDDTTWTPKRSFKSEEEVRNSGFPASLWHAYTCDLCNSIHIASIEKKVGHDVKR